MDTLFEWANDPLVRRNSFNSDPITYEDHQKWFDSMMKDSCILPYILMDNDVPVGQIRLKMEGDTAEISYSIAQEYRGKGYGHSILKLVKRMTSEQYPMIKSLIARVKPSNSQSFSLFQKEGFIEQYRYYSFDIE